MTIKLKPDCELEEAIKGVEEASYDAYSSRPHRLDARTHLLEVIRGMLTRLVLRHRANEIMGVIE